MADDKKKSNEPINLAERRAQRRARNPIDIPRTILVRQVPHGPHKGYITTEGMRLLGHPEIQMFGVPLWMGPLLTGMINQLADALVNGGLVIEDGALIQMEGPFFAFQMSYNDSDGDRRWTIIDDHLEGVCMNPDCPSKH